MICRSREKTRTGWSRYLNNLGECNGCGVMEEGTPDRGMLETCLM
jgi:hypothetical protein